VAALKTKQNKEDVNAFLQTIASEEKRNDCAALLKLMKAITKLEPQMWGDSIVGFGSYHYKSEKSKQEGDWYMTGFSPRKQNITIYIIPGFANYGGLMKKLGKYKTSVSCLYINKLADVDSTVLKELITLSFKHVKENYKKP
jgi:Domain of unknown function (DU1801)